MEQIGKIRSSRVKDECFVKVWSLHGGYSIYGINNNERGKAFVRSSSALGGLTFSYEKFEFMKCGQ